MRILLTEDDHAISDGLSYTLSQEGYAVAQAFTLAQARELLKNEAFDLALLDLNLPDGSGYELCGEIKRQRDIPVIFLTAYDGELNVVQGLDMGADDYIAKPFRVRELLSRIRSVLRRYQKTSEEVLSVGGIQLYPARAKVFKGDTEIALTAMEYRLLLAFFKNPGQVFTRARLLEEIWDVAGDFVNDNTLTVYVKRLREKLEDDAQNPQIIQTVRGLGYRVGEGHDSKS
jgi:two-component system response regulator VicR